MCIKYLRCTTLLACQSLLPRSTGFINHCFVFSLMYVYYSTLVGKSWCFELCVSFSSLKLISINILPVDTWKMLPIEHMSLVSWTAGVPVVDNKIHIYVLLPVTSNLTVVPIAGNKFGSICRWYHDKSQSDHQQ